MVFVGKRRPRAVHEPQFSLKIDSSVCYWLNIFMPFLLPVLFLIGYILKKFLSWKKVFIIAFIFCLPLLFYSLPFTFISWTFALVSPGDFIKTALFFVWPSILIIFGAFVADFFNKRNS